MNEWRQAMAVAQAETDHQMSRSLTRGLRRGMTTHQIAAVRALVFNAALYAIEAWEKGRESRERVAFFEGTSNPLAPAPQKEKEG
jgi:hypothetical protein